MLYLLTYFFGFVCSQNSRGQSILARTLEVENGPLLRLLVKEQVRSADTTLI